MSNPSYEPDISKKVFKVGDRVCIDEHATFNRLFYESPSGYTVEGEIFWTVTSVSASGAFIRFNENTAGWGRRNFSLCKGSIPEQFSSEEEDLFKL